MREHGVLTVRNLAQKVIWDSELSGQISDGKWENTVPYDHWEPWCDAEVVVATSELELGRNFAVKKDNYALDARDLWGIQEITDRTLAAVRLATGPDYTEDDLKADLKDLKTIIKIQRPETEGEKERRQAKVDADLARDLAARDKRNADAAAVQDLADDLGVDVGYIGTSYVSYDEGLSYDKILKLVKAAQDHLLEEFKYA